MHRRHEHGGREQRTRVLRRLGAGPAAAEQMRPSGDRALVRRSHEEDDGPRAAGQRHPESRPRSTHTHPGEENATK